MEPALSSLSSLIGQVGLIGTGCLIALHLADRHVAEDELCAIVHIDSVSTLRRHLRNCEIHEYATSLKRQLKGITFWHITDIGKAIIANAISLLGLPSASTGHPAAATAQPRLIAPGLDVIEEKNFFSALSSSSSDLIDQSSKSGSEDQIEEEEGREFKKFLCREYNLTGERAQAVIDDPRIWSEDLVAWIFQVRQMARDKFKFRKSPESYALACLLKPDGPDRPSDDALSNSRRSLDLYWAQFQQRKQSAEEDNT